MDELRLLEVGRLASKVGHECNNLMAIILAATEFLAEDLDPDSPLIADVKMIEDAARRASTLNRQLLRRS